MVPSAVIRLGPMDGSGAGPGEVAGPRSSTIRPTTYYDRTDLGRPGKEQR